LKITDTTPKVARTFTVELSEKELNTLATALGRSNDCSRSDLARELGVEILHGHHATDLYSLLRQFITKEAV